MFVTSRRRAVYDEKGNLQKLDRLKSVRMKQVPQSVIEDLQEQQSLDVCAIQNDRKGKNNANVVLVVAVVVIVIYAGWDIVTRQLESVSGKFQYQNAYLAPMQKEGERGGREQVSWEELQHQLREQPGYEIELPQSVHSSLKCHILPNKTASCHFTLPLSPQPE